MSREALAIETAGLSKRYRSAWGLQDCSIRVPEGRISALVGPNGAGKTTLLRLLVGLRRPTSGQARVLGRAPAQDDMDFLASVGFLAQEIPLYRQLSAAEHIRIGARLNRTWDAAGAGQRLTTLRVPLDRPVHSLSGGQRAQVALSLALAKRPHVLLLDEPLAALDPLARREFLTSLADVTVEGDVTVMLSSHLVHDLERVCNHLILLTASRVRLCADIDDVLGGHRMLVGPRRSTAELERVFTVVKVTQTERQSRVLARLDGPVLDPAWDVSEVGLEDIILAYMSEDQPLTAGPLSFAGGTGMTFLIWRLHRVHAIVAAVVIVAVTALIVPSGIAIANSYHHAVMNCSVSHVGCGDISFTVFGNNSVFTSLVQDLVMAFPLVLGILWGAPLMAGQFEAGTEDFVWTQGVTRRRWVLTNLGWALLAAAVWGGVLAALFTWWRGPDNAVDGPVKFIYFDVQGIAPVAYTVFAMALGIAAGALFRRVVPAIMTTFIVFPAVRIVIALFFRPLFAVSQNVSPRAGAGTPPLSWSLFADIISSKTEHIIYLPANRFWPVQGVESGIFLVLALALAIFTYWSVTTREA